MSDLRAAFRAGWYAGAVTVRASRDPWVLPDDATIDEKVQAQITVERPSVAPQDTPAERRAPSEEAVEAAARVSLEDQYHPPDGVWDSVGDDERGFHRVLAQKMLSAAYAVDTPSLAVREAAQRLVASWREAAKIRRKTYHDAAFVRQHAYAEALEAVATELERALAPGAGA